MCQRVCPRTPKDIDNLCGVQCTRLWEIAFLIAKSPDSVLCGIKTVPKSVPAWEKTPTTAKCNA